MEAARITIIAKPGSKSPGVKLTEGGIIVAVREPAREGAANDACRRALAKAIGVAPSRVTLSRGAHAKEKLFLVEGVTREAVMSRLAEFAR